MICSLKEMFNNEKVATGRVNDFFSDSFLFDQEDILRVMTKSNLQKQLNVIINEKKTDALINPSENLINCLKSFKNAHTAESFSVGVHDCHQFDEDFYDKSYRFANFIKKEIDELPVLGINTMILSGFYKETLAGIHTDPCDILIIPLLGRKKMYTWNSYKFATVKTKLPNGRIIPQRRNDLEIIKEKEYADLHIAECGEFIYMPAGTWHMNILEDLEYSSALIFSFFRKASLPDLIKNIFATTCDQLYKIGTPTNEEIKSATLESMELFYYSKNTSCGLTPAKLDKTLTSILSQNLKYSIRSKDCLKFYNGSKSDYIISCGNVLKFNPVLNLEKIILFIINKETFYLNELYEVFGNEDIINSLCSELIRTKSLALYEK